ncbi:hypothetical protein [Actinoplanes subtropicus]|uniref:hypothetical protein n=1 Tax=Actinoplanes subtropicus TaxID=543632 RepID=UPI000A4CD0AE|nr:hypothetical protein [Actinoplanes subtropicus]
MDVTDMLSTRTERGSDTVIADWYLSLAGNRSSRRNHWTTKVMYYEAVTELLDSHPDHPITWKGIVGAARPRGCRSTFYEVAGSQARRGMVDHLIADGSITSYTIALHYRTTDPIVRLIDEAKVWSFWSYRQRFRQAAAGGGDPDRLPEPLRAVLADWARAHPGLAAANCGRPPACAVEDLTELSAGLLAPIRAEALLTEALRT